MRSCSDQTQKATSWIHRVTGHHGKHALAFWLMTPYVAWVLYASYLNFGIWRLNKGTA